MFFGQTDSLVMANFIIGVKANISGNHKIVGVTREAQGDPPLIEMPPMIKMMTLSLCLAPVLVSFSIFRVQQSRVQQQLAIILILTTKKHGSLNTQGCHILEKSWKVLDFFCCPGKSLNFVCKSWKVLENVYRVFP